MYRFLFLLCFVFLQISLLAQVRLDVEGDAKIMGKINLIQAIGDSSVFIGGNAGLVDDGGNWNAFIGSNAGRSNTSGYFNTFVGHAAGRTNLEGRNNTFIGANAGRKNTTGNNNVFMGSLAGLDNTEGISNVFIGSSAGQQNESGFANTYIGVIAGANNNGDRNIIMGFGAGQSLSDGSGNVLIGNLTASGQKGTTQNNTMIGTNAGEVVGFLVDSAIAIGYKSIVSCSNCAVIGGIEEYAVNLGVGENTPTERLHVADEENVAMKAVAGNEFYSSLKLFAEGATSSEGDNGFELLYDDEYQDFRLFRRNLADGNGEVVTWTSDGDMELFGDLDVDGDLYVDGDGEIRGDLDVHGTFINSDKRFKKQIKQLENPLTSLQRVNGVSYAFRTKEFAARNFSNGRTLGLIAQEVEKVFPMLVKEDETGYKSVNYDGLIPVLIEATKEQQQVIDRQKEMLKTQGQELIDLKQQLSELKGAVEKLLTAQPVPQKTNNYTLPLLQQPSLGQNQPNPFNESTLIDYYLPQNFQHAKIQVTALGGKVLGEVLIREKGQGQVNIQAHTYPAGTYYYSLIVDGQMVETKKMVLIQR